MRPWLAPLLLAALAGGCAEAPPQALGTLEYERVEIPAPLSERIASIEVREGEEVGAGAVLLGFEDARLGAELRALDAEAERQGGALAELEAGARAEDIAAARAALDAAVAQAGEANAYFARLRPLGERQLVAASDIDRARAAARDADARVRQARAVLAALANGTRPERVDQGAAAVRAARAQADARRVTLDDLSVRAPRAGRIDSLPFEVGARPPAGAAVAILLVGPAPHARVYVPQPLRAGLDVGDAARVFVSGADGERAFQGRIRTIRREPSFTPYYALAGDDAARLVYLAEIELTDAGARGLPAGLPVRAEFPGAGE